MKVRSSLIAPIIAASLLVPAVGTAIVKPTANTSSQSTSMEKEDHKGTHHKWEKGEGQKGLTNIINQYATPQLKDQFTKDLATRESLMKQLRQTPGIQKKEGQEKAQRQAFYQAHKQEIDSIKQQLKDGKITKQQAHQQLQAIFGKEHGKEQSKDKGKEQGKSGVYQELKAAVQKKDTAAINSALQKLDQQLQSSNQQLQQKINANK
ncbi:hypothetical protein [Neobacillus massiliamazoniensis]|uniref:LTXXQ motif family protein n=1 Tax=Neobacillus massiliamazoniensis TaxID=1499688 RepID=A0A0U1NT12_9BACI|nr:hypothetical protein [Neobacillus massiliamazoniensis]CRK81200.1 hypothetical protein BN000_01100 [Neobacillus massiliamazoniensis]